MPAKNPTNATQPRSSSSIEPTCRVIDLQLRGHLPVAEIDEVPVSAHGIEPVRALHQQSEIDWSIL